MQSLQSHIKTEDLATSNVLRDLQHHMTSYGYQVLETPIIESADLFLTKAGDQVAERLFTFERHGYNLALRPEFTASAAHHYITHFQDTHPTVRWQFNGPIFEDDPREPGHKYQRLSMGAELMGMHGPAAEAEIISMAAAGLSRQAIKDQQIVIGHVGLTRNLLERFALDTRTQQFILHRRDLLKDTVNGRNRLLEQLNQYFPSDQYLSSSEIPSEGNGDTHQMLDVLLDTTKRGQTMGGRTRQDISKRMFVKRKQASQREQIDDAIFFLQGWMNISSLPKVAFDEIERFIGADVIAWEMFAGWKKTMELLEVYQIPTDQVLIQPDLARSWDYYTGLVFEIQTSDGIQLAGGGRYDELTRLIGGKTNIPAFGFAYYIDNLMEQVESIKEVNPRTLLLLASEETITYAIQWSRALRDQGIAVALIDTPQESEDEVLSINYDGSLQFQHLAYVPEQIDFLILALNRA